MEQVKSVTSVFLHYLSITSCMPQTLISRKVYNAISKDEKEKGNG